MKLRLFHIASILIILFLSGALNAFEFSSDIIKQERAEKDAFFKTGKDSPMPVGEKAGFKGLNYYEPNEKFVIPAKFEKYSEPDTVKMKTSKKERVKAFLRYGYFTFNFEGKKFKLNAFLILPLSEHNELFVPFTDESCGFDSYSAGRYLDISELDDRSDYLLDFNYSYNPYCAYNKKYTCPLVPPENHLPFEVRAGERKYKDE